MFRTMAGTAPNVAQQLIHSHLVDGRPEPGEEIGLRIDQTLRPAEPRGPSSSAPRW